MSARTSSKGPSTTVPMGLSRYGRPLRSTRSTHRATHSETDVPLPIGVMLNSASVIRVPRHAHIPRRSCHFRGRRLPPPRCSLRRGPRGRGRGPGLLAPRARRGRRSATRGPDPRRRGGHGPLRAAPCGVLPGPRPRRLPGDDGGLPREGPVRPGPRGRPRPPLPAERVRRRGPRHGRPPARGPAPGPRGGRPRGPSGGPCDDGHRHAAARHPRGGVPEPLEDRPEAVPSYRPPRLGPGGRGLLPGGRRGAPSPADDPDVRAARTCPPEVRLDPRPHSAGRVPRGPRIPREGAAPSLRGGLRDRRRVHFRRRLTVSPAAFVQVAQNARPFRSVSSSREEKCITHAGFGSWSRPRVCPISWTASFATRSPYAGVAGGPSRAVEMIPHRAFILPSPQTE